MCFFGKFSVVFRITVCIRILQDAGKEVICKFKIPELSGTDFNALRDGASGDDRQGLREDIFVDKHHVGSAFCWLRERKPYIIVTEHRRQRWLRQQ